MRSLIHPLIVRKHKNVRTHLFFASWALRNVFRFKGICVQIKLLTPTLFNSLAFCTLYMKNWAIAFLNLTLLEACFLEMTINIWSENECVFMLSKLFQNIKSLMRSCFGIGLVSMTVKKPEFMWILSEEFRVCSVLKRHSYFLEIRINLPETMVSSEVWKSRVNTHTCTCSNQECMRIFDHLSSYFVYMIRLH